MSAQPSTAHDQGRGLAFVFAASGFVLASWGARLPALRDAAGLSAQDVGWLVGAMGVGTVVALVTGGRTVRYFGVKGSIKIGALLSSVALACAALPVRPVVMLCAGVLGAGNGLYDVAMNSRGSDLQKTSGDPGLMARLHGWFSVGAMAGAGGAAVFAYFTWSLAAHFLLTSLLSIAVTWCGFRGQPTSGQRKTPVRLIPRFTAWQHRRTWALGLVVLGAAFAEGAANEWLTTALTSQRGYQTTDSSAAVALAVFATGMVVTRFWLGPRLTKSVRRMAALATSLACVTAGTGIVIVTVLLVDAEYVAYALVAIGLFVWGVGAAVGVPVALAAASRTSKQEKRRDESRTPDRVSMVETVGFASFIVMAPGLSWFGERVGFIWTLASAPGIMISAFAASWFLHPRGSTLTDQAWDAARQKIVNARQEPAGVADL